MSRDEEIERVICAGLEFLMAEFIGRGASEDQIREALQHVEKCFLAKNPDDNAQECE